MTNKKRKSAPLPKAIKVHDPVRIHDSSRNFLMGARRCFEKRQLPDGRSEWPAVAGIVCLAFSVELGLKALLAYENSAVKDHKLLALFNKLAPGSRQTIINDMRLTELAARQKIASMSSTFEEWRYVYEYGHLSADPDFLEKFATAIESLLMQKSTASTKTPTSAASPAPQSST